MRIYHSLNLVFFHDFTTTKLDCTLVVFLTPEILMMV